MLAAFSLALGLGLSLPAHAGVKVAVLEFEGAGSRALRSAVVRQVRQLHTVVPLLALRSTAARLRLSTRCTPDRLLPLARALRVDAVVCGRLVPSRSPVLLVSIYAGRSGELFKVLKGRLSRWGLVSENMRGLYSSLDRVLSALDSPLPGRGGRPVLTLDDSQDSDETASFALTPRSREPADHLPRADLVASLPESQSAEPAFTTTDVSELFETVPAATMEEQIPPPHTVRSRPKDDTMQPERSEPARQSLHALSVSAGPSFLLRRHYAVYGAGTAQDGGEFKSRPVAGVAVELDLFPAMLFLRGWTDHIGLGVSYQRSIGLSWTSTEDGEQQSATHEVFSADLRGRYSFRLGRRGLGLGARAGYRFVGFRMNDTSQHPAQIPDVAFSSFVLGLCASFDLLPRYLVVSALFDYLPLLHKGEITSQSEYGSGSGQAYSIGGGLHGRLFGPLGWRLAVEYSRYTVSFDRNPAARRSAAKARDTYTSGQVFLTYRY